MMFMFDTLLQTRRERWGVNEKIREESCLKNGQRRILHGMLERICIRNGDVPVDYPSVMVMSRVCVYGTHLLAQNLAEEEHQLKNNIIHHSARGQRHL
jgi:hypothetical protein